MVLPWTWDFIPEGAVGYCAHVGVHGWFRHLVGIAVHQSPTAMAMPHFHSIKLRDEASQISVSELQVALNLA